MNGYRKLSFLSAAVLIGALAFTIQSSTASAQTQSRLTYPELNTALNTKLPNRSFANKAELVNWLITQIKRRKVDKPLTSDREDDLRQAGATDELIDVIRTNSPQEPKPAGPVDLGDLVPHAINMVKPEYTPEALQAGTVGEVKLSLELDEQGRVISIRRLTVLANGLTEKAVEAAQRSTFRPAVRDGKPARAIGVITYNFKINLNIASTLTAANELRRKRDCDRAISEYNRIIAVDVRNAQAIFGRGSCYLIKGDRERAGSDLENAAVLAPNDAEILFTLGIVRDLASKHAEGAEAYEKALSLKPDYDSQPPFVCLFIDRKSMTPQRARDAANGIIANCNQAIRTAAPEFENLLVFKRAIAQRLKGDYERAIEDLENVRRKDPTLSSVNTQFLILYNNRGLEAFNKKDYKKAFDDISLAIKADPQNPTPYVNRCTIYLYGWKQYDEAIRDCSEAVRLGTKSSMAYNHRGYAYELKKSLSEAAADYQKALQLDPQNATARANLERIRPKVPSLRDQ